MSVVAFAAWVGGCGGSVTSTGSDAGVLTKGHGGGSGTAGSGGVTVGAGGVGGMGTGGHSATGGSAAGGGGAGVGGTGVGGDAGGSTVVVDGGVMDMRMGNDGQGNGGDARMDMGPPMDGGRDVQGGDDAPADVIPVDMVSVDVMPVDAAADTGNCPAKMTAWAAPNFARSAGYSGTLSDYSDLYNVTCMGLQACKESCVAAGGTADSCMAGSQCETGGSGSGRHCLPPTYWRYGDRALDESADFTDAAEQTLVVLDYNDPLAIRDFRLNIPAGATIEGIQFRVHRSADADSAVDDSVRILRGGQPVGMDHKKNDPWPMDLTYVMYGGPNDTWGVTFTPDDIEAAGFGIAIAAKYTQNNGNARAYIDYAEVRVHYTPATCN